MMNNGSLAGMQIPPGGLDPRMVAFLQAQQRLQQQQPNSNQNTTGQGTQKPGGDADVASFLLQLKTNQNGEQVPMTEAEALRMQAEHQAALQAARGLPPQMSQTPGLAAPGYPPNNGMPPLSMYGYPPMGAFLPNTNFAGLAAAMGGMPGGPAAGYGGIVPPMPPQPQSGGIPGLNHSMVPSPSPAVQSSQSQQLGPMSGANASDPGPSMTDAYIESLISNDVVIENMANKTKIKNKKDSEEYGEGGDKTKDTKEPKKEYPDDGTICAKDDMDIPLVVPKDRDLIPDALFVALGQMKATKLQQSDRVGCYKTRHLDFLGMCCKHCGGQPGFGRYFPNSVRSLAQTTTSQTILKHIAGKCRFCPASVRKAVLELQRQQAHKEHMTTVGRPRYGSRKIFFQRMWARLHGKSPDGESALVVQSDVSPEVARDEAARAATEMTLSPSPPVTGGIKEAALSATTTNRSQPPEVSNNNSDDEDPESAAMDSQKNGANVVEIKLTLNKSSKRKLEDSCDEDEAKKLRISPVAV